MSGHGSNDALVGAELIGPGVVTAAAITALNVTTAKIQDDAVQNGNIAALTINTACLANNAVTQAKLPAGSIPLVPTFANQTAARAVGGIYQNGATCRLVIIAARFQVAAGGAAQVNCTAQLLSDVNNPPVAERDTSSTGNIVRDGALAWGVPLKFFAIIDPNEFYQLTDTCAAGGVLIVDMWTEYDA